MKSIDSNYFDTIGNAVVDFWAPWCHNCKLLMPILERAEQELGIEILKFDVDGGLLLAQKYGVRSLPALLKFENGTPVKMKIFPTIPSTTEDLKLWLK